MQLLAIIIFLDTSDDDNNIGTIGVMVNSLWTWMMPICLAWVWIGSQTSHSTTRDALQNASRHCFAARGELITEIRDRTGDSSATVTLLLKGSNRTCLFPHRIRMLWTRHWRRGCGGLYGASLLFWPPYCLLLLGRGSGNIN